MNESVSDSFNVTLGNNDTQIKLVILSTLRVFLLPQTQQHTAN